MGKKDSNSTPQSQYERLKRLANIAMWTISLQYRRITSSEPEDNDFIFRIESDFSFLIVTLQRLRRIALTAKKEIPELKDSLSQAINDFEKALPSLKIMRNVAEHIDEYAIDEGNDQSVERRYLEISKIDEEYTLYWLGHSLNALEALRASKKLFCDIKKCQNLVKKP